MLGLSDLAPPISDPTAAEPALPRRAMTVSRRWAPVALVVGLACAGVGCAGAGASGSRLDLDAYLSCLAARGVTPKTLLQDSRQGVVSADVALAVDRCASKRPAIPDPDSFPSHR